jgi:archaeosine synthase beta-subunit
MSESATSENSPDMTLPSYVAELYDSCGQRKSVTQSIPPSTLPHFFLLRTFLGANDLLVILNTKRCRYQCAFCRLPAKSTRTWVTDDDVSAQFRFVASELRHALSIVDRVTLSNEGSVLDTGTLGTAALEEIVTAIGMMRRVRRIELETRLEFIEPDVLRQLQLAAPRAKLGILTGFETRDERIRDQILKKREPLALFCAGLDSIQQVGAALTAYVLFKPDPEMTDQAACDEATATVAFLSDECEARDIDLTIRLNPMYRAVGSPWARKADLMSNYSPPRLTDVMHVAEEASARGIKVYIGLSAEGLATEDGTYRARDDFSAGLIKWVKQFNDRQRIKFPWDAIEVDCRPVNHALAEPGMLR